MDVRFDHYYRHAELTELLEAFAAKHPQIVSLSSLGKSNEGREIWLLTVTRFDTGPAREKPALWVDGNIHAAELAPSSACLHLLHTLTTQYGTDPDVTRCLDTRAFYICPRINPDGAEWALAERPKLIRSSTRPYPHSDQPLHGLLEGDIDGDGRLLSMRIPDPNGAWKVSAREPRLMVRREPTEAGGIYYRILPEGRLAEPDPWIVTIPKARQRLDFNRNFPASWRQEHEQPGAGPYPTSEPEVRGLVAFISRHPNITAGVAFHTHSGVVLRPFSNLPDEAFPIWDLRTYETIGQKVTELTGYPVISIFHDFRDGDHSTFVTGAFDDWIYGHQGVFGWTVELWCPQRAAGIEDFKVLEWYREHPFEDDLKMLAWSDEVLDGTGHVEWYPFEHPDFGPVELGGWDWLHAFRNPPESLLEQEIAPFANWLVWHLLVSPRLEVRHASATPIADDERVFRVVLVVENTGWLPSYITKRAVERSLVRGVRAEIGLPPSVTLISPERKQEKGQLEGRAYKPSTPIRWKADATADRCRFEWIVRGNRGEVVALKARHDRAGTVRCSLPLGDESL